MHQFYYLRDEHNRPIVTVCLMYIEGYVSRGIALCSPKDNPCKKIGRGIAYNRASKAIAYNQGLLNGRCSSLIRRKEVKKHVELLEKEGIEHISLPYFYDNLGKIYFDPQLTACERKIFLKMQARS